jgi:hypothetical protein
MAVRGLMMEDAGRAAFGLSREQLYFSFTESVFRICDCDGSRPCDQASLRACVRALLVR